MRRKFTVVACLFETSLKSNTNESMYQLLVIYLVLVNRYPARNTRKHRRHFRKNYERNHQVERKKQNPNKKYIDFISKLNSIFEVELQVASRYKFTGIEI